MILISHGRLIEHLHGLLELARRGRDGARAVILHPAWAMRLGAAAVRTQSRAGTISAHALMLILLSSSYASANETLAITPTAPAPSKADRLLVVFEPAAITLTTCFCVGILIGFIHAKSEQRATTKIRGEGDKRVRGVAVFSAVESSEDEQGVEAARGKAASRRYATLKQEASASSLKTKSLPQTKSRPVIITQTKSRPVIITSRALPDTAALKEVAPTEEGPEESPKSPKSPANSPKSPKKRPKATAELVKEIQESAHKEPFHIFQPSVTAGLGAAAAKERAAHGSCIRRLQSAVAAISKTTPTAEDIISKAIQRQMPMALQTDEGKDEVVGRWPESLREAAAQVGAVDVLRPPVLVNPPHPAPPYPRP